MSSTFEASIARTLDELRRDTSVRDWTVKALDGLRAALEKIVEAPT